MVQLLGHVFVHGIDDNYLVLYAHLFPNRTQRDTNNEWGVYPSRNSESDIIL